AAGLRVTVDDVKGLVVRRHGDAVGPLHVRLRQDPRHLAVGVDAVNPFDVQLQVAAVGAGARVGEPDAPPGIDADVAGPVVALAVELLRQDGDVAALEVGADDAPPAAGAVLGAFAADQPTLGVEGVAVSAAAVGAEDGHLTLAGHFKDA